jgi:Pyruvate/2-oxoacid:ferredoxin oxidoreductase delta subunit
MVQMPSNWMIETPEHEAINLIKELPNKIETMIDEVLSGKERHRKPELGGRILTFLFKVEKISIWQFGKSLKINSNCKKCSFCINNCPKNNIINNGLKLIFGFSCEGCLKCVYSCPNNAIYSRLFSFALFKNGYSMEKYNFII